MSTPLASASDGGICRGSAGWRRMVAAMAAAGFSSFAIMNAVQPLMPQFSAEFGITAASASLSLSVTILALALAMLFTAPLSDRLGRKRVMSSSLFLSAISMLLTAAASDWQTFLALRALCGVAIAGVPAIAIAWISDEVAAKDRAAATGYYIAGAAFGGMSGRIIAGFAGDWLGWHGGMAAVGLIGLASAVSFVALLPASRKVTRVSTPSPGAETTWPGASFAEVLRNGTQLRLYLIGGLLMGALVSVYNYLGYRLQASPFDLGPGAVSALFLTYIVGIFTAPLAGRQVARFGPRRSLIGAILVTAAGLFMTLFSHLALIGMGLVLFTGGFFAAHSVAGGWVTNAAPGQRAQAATLYLLVYYIGGALGGWLTGYIWLVSGWTGVALYCLTTAGGAFLLVPRKI